MGDDWVDVGGLFLRQHSDWPCASDAAFLRPVSARRGRAARRHRRHRRLPNDRRACAAAPLLGALLEGKERREGGVKARVVRERSGKFTEQSRCVLCLWLVLSAKAV